jgi:hypothetical protein
MYIALHVKYPLFLSDCNDNFIFLSFFSFLENALIQYLVNIRPVGTKLFHADKETDGNDEFSRRFPLFCEGNYTYRRRLLTRKDM